jgi:hypothetical protein
MSIDHGRQLLESFKDFFSKTIYSALEETSALLLIANNKINLEKIKQENNCYTFSFLLNEYGYEALNKNYISFDEFLSVPKSERYTLHYLFKDGLKFLEKGLIDLKQFLAVPEKQRESFVARHCEERLLRQSNPETT